MNEKINYATVQQRVSAYAIDAILMYVIIWVIQNFFFLVKSYGFGFKYDLILSLLYILPFLYFAIAHFGWQRTFGKKSIGIKVINKNGRKLTLIQSFIRYIPEFLMRVAVLLLANTIYETQPDGTIISSSSSHEVFNTYYPLLIYLIVGYWVVQFFLIIKRKDGRTLHDFLAKSVVIVNEKGNKK